jgi:hypothetical protein
VGIKWTDLGGSFSLWNNGERALHGVAFLFNINHGVVVTEDKNDNDGRVFDLDFHLCNVYFFIV